MATLYLVRNIEDPSDFQVAEGKVAAKKALDAVRESAVRHDARHLGISVDYEIVPASDALSEAGLADLEAALERGGVAPANLED